MTYWAVHKALTRMWGKAADYLCWECGGPARDWALTGVPTAFNPAGLGYSEDLTGYLPYCHRCHFAMDYAGKRCPHWPDREVDSQGGCRACRREANARSSADPEFRAKKRQRAQERYVENQARETQRHRESHKKRMEDPEYRAKMKEKDRVRREKIKADPELHEREKQRNRDRDRRAYAAARRRSGG